MPQTAMKIGIYFSLFMFSAMICNSCNQGTYYTGETKTIVDFPQTIEIVGELLPITCPGALTISTCDSLLFISTDRRPAAALDIFDLHSNQRLGTFCTKGKGPNEFISFHHYGQYIVDTADCILLPAIDYGRKLTVMDITQSIAQRRTCFQKLLPWEEFYFRASGIFLLNGDSLLIQYPAYKIDARDYNYFLPQTVLYVNGQPIKTYEIFTRKVDTPQFSHLASFVFDAISVLKPDQTKWAEGLRGVDYLNIVDVKSGEVVGVKTQGSPSLERIGTESFEQLRFYYMSVAATDEQIFALYVDQPIVQFQTTPSPGEIRIFDWSAMPLARLKFKENLLWITVSNDNRTLYGLDYEERIYRYDLSSIR